MPVPVAPASLTLWRTDLMAEQRICDRCLKLYWWPAAAWQHEKCVANAASNTATMANSEPQSVANTSTYRYRDAEARRAYQREYMRVRRSRIERNRDDDVRAK